MPGSKINVPGLPPDVVPVLLETNSFKYEDENKNMFYISRTQLPLLPAYAFTANKIQGQSLQHSLVLGIMHWFPSQNVDQRLSEEYREKFDHLKN